jgi:hypothetical protein
MAHDHSASTAWPDPRALATSLDAREAERLSGDDRQALRASLARAARSGDLIVADGLQVGRVLPWGSVALYRPDPAAPLEHRLVELDPGGRITLVLERAASGELHAAWASLADGSAVGMLPGGARHPLWGASDRLVREAPGRAPDTLTVAGAVAWGAVDVIPPVAEPGRLPPGAGGAVLNVLAALAHDQGRSPLRYRGPFPTEQLFWSLTESFRFAGADDALPRFVTDAEGTFARGVSAEAPVDWRPAPHERRLHADGLAVQLRDGVERIMWQGRIYHREECQGLRRREHRVVRVTEGEAGPRYVASLAALGGILEDHLSLDARAEVLERHAPGLEPPGSAPVAEPWREALGALLPLEATPLLAGAIEAVWPGIALDWGPVPGDLVAGSGASLRVSPKLARAYRSRHGGLAGKARRTLAQQLVREVLGLIGPAVRAAATAWLEALPPARQEAELDAAARRDRVALARAALTPLGRLLDGLERGAGLPE